jgi:hypothetical protein
MPSSTSSSERAPIGPGRIDEAPFERALPHLPAWPVALLAGLSFLLAMAAWETYWRTQGAEPSYRNSDGLWAIQRRRIDHGEGSAVVAIGSSRLMFDLQLDVWQRLSGVRPIQLSLQGTSAMPVLEDLADDPDFTGTLLVGVTPGLFFSGFGLRKEVVEYARRETPAQRASQWLSMHGLENRFAWYEPDFALFTVIERQDWPRRHGVERFPEVPKISNTTTADRNHRMWTRVEHDVGYARSVQQIWVQRRPTRPPTQEQQEKHAAEIEREIARAVAAVAKLRARGVRVVFVRAPSSGEVLEGERRRYPREKTWDLLLARTGAPGIHFEDHPDMQDLRLPEWSHLAGADADRWTAALHRAYAALPDVQR